MSEVFMSRHVLIDAVLMPKGKFVADSGDSIRWFLEQLTVKLGMTLITPPFVARVPFDGGLPEQWAHEDSPLGARARELVEARKGPGACVSGLAWWWESHAAVHTWPATPCLSFDAYSCKDFDAALAELFLYNYFIIESYTGLSIRRMLGAPSVVEVLEGKRNV